VRGQENSSFAPDFYRDGLVSVGAVCKSRKNGTSCAVLLKMQSCLRLHFTKYISTDCKQSDPM